MKYTVLKFGGTSLGNTERINNVIDIIKESTKTNKIVTVVSAMSALIKTEGTTSRLIMAKDYALSHGQYIRIIDSILEYHVNIAKQVIEDKNLQDATIEQIEGILNKLKSFLKAIEVIQEISYRVEDIIIGTGERLSACMIANSLTSKGLEAEYTDLSDIMSSIKSTEVNKDFYEKVKDKLREIIQNCEGVPILTGFIGMMPGGLLNTIGRGYTDFTAGLSAAALSAEELQIWKEVDGLYTSDPNKVKNAKIINRVSAAEASEITYYGSEVVHPMTMEQVILAKVPIRIKNTLRPKVPGTVIDTDDQWIEKTNKPIAVTAKSDILVINITSNRMLHAPGFMYNVFQIMNKHKLVVDLISTSEVSISMTVDKKNYSSQAVTELEALGNVVVRENLSIISLVGAGMKESVGTSARFFAALAKKNINIEMISQGASEINISCIIAQSHVLDALQEIHDELLI